jgi:hypothetical protein
MPTFTAAVFTVHKQGKQPICSSAVKWVNKLCYAYTHTYTNIYTHIYIHIHIHTYNGLLFSLRKMKIYTCYHMYKSQKHYIRNESITKKYIMYDFTYMKYPESANL